MKKTILLGCLLSINICTNASSGPFSIGDGTVPPKSQHGGILDLSIKPLPSGGVFDITCDIRNPNYSKPYPVVLEAYGSLNGVTSSTHKYLLNQEISKFSVREGRYNLDVYQGLRFMNHDDTDAVYVENCMAVYATS